MRVAQKHAICPPNKNTPFICHDPLSQKSSFTKENVGYAKKIMLKKSMKRNPC